MRHALLALAFVMAAASSVGADTQVGVVVTGEPSVQPALAATFESWLREHGYTLVPSPLPPDAINTAIDCFAVEDEVCARSAIIGSAIAPAVVYVRVDAGPSSATGLRTLVIATHYYPKTGESKVDKRTCEQCTDDVLAATVGTILTSFVGDAHVGAGGSTTEPVAPAGPERPIAAKRSKLLPISLLAGGGVVLVAGAILIGTDEDPQGIPDSQARYRDTAPLGIGLAVAGAAVATVGIVLFVTATGGESRVGSPTASVGANHAIVGWSGSF